MPKMNLDPLRRGMSHLALLVSGGLIAALGMSYANRPFSADDSLGEAPEISRLEADLALTKGQLQAAQRKLHRMKTVGQYSAAYRVPADLAGMIYDEALAAGIHPSLGFQLVKVESSFRPYARSHKGAIGLTQLMLPTAREIDPSVTADQLRVPRLNLRIGFTVLTKLLDRFDNDLEMALRAYNLGPTGALQPPDSTTGEIKGAGYAEAVMGDLRDSLPVAVRQLRSRASPNETP